MIKRHRCFILFAVILHRLSKIEGGAFFAPLWSNVSFGNDEYVGAFIFVSLLILFEQLNNGELVFELEEIEQIHAGVAEMLQ